MSERPEFDAPQPNPFENAKIGECFCAVSGSPEGIDLQVWWRESTVGNFGSGAARTCDDGWGASMEATQCPFVPIDLRIQSGEIIEILTEASSPTRLGFNDYHLSNEMKGANMIVIKYWRKFEGVDRLLPFEYRVMVSGEQGLPGGVEWEKLTQAESPYEPGTGWTVA